MKPSELFPGAVALASCSMWEGQKVGVITSAHNAVAFVKTDYRPGSVTLSYEALSPLPLSPAVLRGLGFVKTDNPGEASEWQCGEIFVVDDSLIEYGFNLQDVDGNGIDVQSAHQLQALALHLYGVGLVWNNARYEEAMKEETK